MAWPVEFEGLNICALNIGINKVHGAHVDFRHFV